MFNNKNFLRALFFIAGILLMVGLAACTPETPVIEPPEIDPEIETVVPAATETRETPPVPDEIPTVLLVSGAAVDPLVWSQTEVLLESLAAESGMMLVTVEGLAPDRITPDVKIVIGMGTGLDLNGLAASAPNVSFAAINDPDAAVTENLSLIGDPVVGMRQQAFLAGYVSALISQDFKIVALIAEENPLSDSLVESFVVGARYFCGICQPIFPPYNPFPQWQALSSGIAQDGFRTVIDSYDNIGVEVIYIQGELVSPERLAYLEEVGMKVVSDRSSDVVSNNWIGTLAMNLVPSLEALWPDLLGGMPGRLVPAAVTLRDTESGLMTAGRYRLFEAMVVNVQTGMVSVEIVP
jgi:hypothetical protein